MAIGAGLPDVRDPGVSAIPDVRGGAGIAEASVAAMYADMGQAARAVRDQALAMEEKAAASYIAGAHADVRAKVVEAAQAHPYDTTAFLRAADQARIAYKKAAPVVFHDRLDALFGQETTYQVEDVARAAQRRQNEIDALTLKSNIDALRNRAMAYALRGDTTSGNYQAALEQWKGAFETWASNPLSGLAPETADRAWNQYVDEVTLVAAREQAMEIYAREGARSALAYARDVALDPDLDAPPETREAMIGEVEQAIRQAETERRLRENEFSSTLSRLESNFGLMLDPLTKAVERGVLPSPIELADMRENAIALDQLREAAGEVPAHLARIDALTDQALYRQMIASAAPSEIEAEIARLRSETAAPGAAGLVVGRLEAAEAALRANEPAWRENPLGAARAAGWGDIPPLTFDGEAGELVGQFAQRAAIADAIEERSAAETPLLEPAERRALARALADPSRGVQLAQALAAGAPARFEEELAAVSDLDEQSAVIAWSARLALADAGPQAQNIALGIALRAEPEFQSAIPTGKADEERLADVFREEAGTAFAGTVYDGRLRAAAEAIYEVLAQERRVGPGALDVPLWREAIRQAAGGSGEWGGVARVGRGRSAGQVVAPAWIKRERFDNVVLELSEGELISAGGAQPLDPDGYPLSASELSSYRMRNVDGRTDRYYFLARDGSPVMRYTADGRFVPYVLDLSMVRGRLRERFPRAVR